jgi:hypothetical protein
MLRGMKFKSLEFPPAKKLKLLRKLDIFHPWDSLDEERFCRRCGAHFTGREIRVRPGYRGGARYRLQCPTRGCPSVPIEWILPEQSFLPAELERFTQPSLTSLASSLDSPPTDIHSRFLGFLWMRRIFR